MSIRTAQTQKVLEDIVHTLYAQGTLPTLNNIFSQLSEYFAKYPVGLPLPIPVEYIVSQQVSDIDKFNLILAHLTMNLDILYEVSLDQVDEIMLLTAKLQSDLAKLQMRRKRIETQIDDFLLSIYNTDGYFFSISDTFADTSLVDLSLTSAYVDTTLSAVTLPTISSASKKLDNNLITLSSIETRANNSPISFQSISSWSNAVDDLTDTVWEIQVSTDTPLNEVTAILTLKLGDNDNTVDLSRVDITPYGIESVQVWMEAGDFSHNDTAPSNYNGFGNKIETGSDKMTFVDVLTEVTNFRINLRKTKYDFVDQSTGTNKYRYIFGAKDIAFVEQIYDNEATMISMPLTIPEELTNDIVIDAVSMIVDEEIAPDTSISYYIASDGASFNWQKINPLASNTQAGTIVRFDGANKQQKFITDSPQGNDLQLIPFNSSDADLTKRNPSPVIVPGVDIYRLATFTDTPILNSLTLEEGVNSTKIYYTDYDKIAVNSLSWWKDKLDTSSVAYGRIDIGHEFFYGGIVGESHKSIYIETYLDSLSDQQPILAECRKSDPNSQTWSVRVFLNGREVGFLPGRNSDSTSAIDSMIIPWTFRKGKNHVGILLNIPSPTQVIPNPYIGTLNLMGDRDLFAYGTVKLSDWSYASLFDIQYNQTGEPTSFTIYNDEIVSRRKPTTNYRLSYATSTDKGPTAIRIRADLQRDIQNIHVTPILNSYRLRFAYGE